MDIKYGIPINSMWTYTKEYQSKETLKESIFFLKKNHIPEMNIFLFKKKQDLFRQYFFEATEASSSPGAL